MTFRYGVVDPGAPAPLVPLPVDPVDGEPIAPPVAPVFPLLAPPSPIVPLDSLPAEVPLGLFMAPLDDPLVPIPELLAVHMSLPRRPDSQVPLTLSPLWVNSQGSPADLSLQA
jgi:hypothetical protein